MVSGRLQLHPYKPIMHVMFDRSHVTVRNVQAHCYCQQDLLQVYIGWLLIYRSTACSSKLCGHVAIIMKPSLPFPVYDVVMVPGILPIFLHSYEIKSGSGLGMRLPKSIAIACGVMLIAYSGCLCGC